LTGKPIEHQESLQIVKYEKEGHFIGHYDACFGTADFCERLNSGIGPRYMTVLIYLNDDYKGGSTSFPRINQHITPEKGKAIIFYNVHKDGTLIYESFHQGNKIEDGTKWIANKWIRIPLDKNRSLFERIFTFNT
jgi:prolyl 4-hydroxylase